MAKAKFPPHGWLGLSLACSFWALNWTLEGPRTHWGFFPMWLGYCLAVDGLTVLRKGDSLLTRNRKAYVGLFLVSAPTWWIFEFINERTQNWAYVGMDEIDPWIGEILATLSFSTVIPAVFGTAELVGIAGWIRRLPRFLSVPSGPAFTVALFLFGWASLAGLFLWPRVLYPFVWISLYCIIDPLNVRLGHRSLLGSLGEGDWRPALSLALGCLACGFFWEMWNFYSLPRWVYDVPLFGFGKIFEMPVLGYGGYVPFSFELFALYHLVVGAFSRGGERGYVLI